MTAPSLLDAPVVTFRFRQWFAPNPMLDGEGRVVGHALKRFGLQLRDTDGAVVVHVKHSTGVTVFSADRWRLVDASKNQIGAIDTQGQITFRGENVGRFDVGRSYTSGTVTTLAGAEIAQIEELRKEKLLEAYGRRWRLERTHSIDSSLKIVALACLGGLFLARIADLNVG